VANSTAKIDGGNRPRACSPSRLLWTAIPRHSPYHSWSRCRRDGSTAVV
jgi:hypothetical protein